MATEPSRGEVWRVDLDPVRGHEQGRPRPCVVVSDDIFNHGPAGIVAIVPLTTRERGVPLHVAVDPPDGGITQRSFIRCEDVRSVSVEHFSRRYGVLSETVMSEVEDRLRIFLSL